MYKTIAVCVMITSSALAHNIPQDTLDKLKINSPQEKYEAEKKKALRDLTISGACAAVSLVIIGTMYIYFNTCGNYDLLVEEYTAETVNSIAQPIVYSDMLLGAFSAYKGYHGIKHYFWPNYPKPEEKHKEIKAQE